MQISRIYESRRGEKSIHEFSKEQLDEFNWKTSKKTSRGIERRNDRFGAYFILLKRGKVTRKELSIEKQKIIRYSLENLVAKKENTQFDSHQEFGCVSAFPRTMTHVSSLPRSKEKKFTAAISGGGVVPQPVYLNFSSHYRSFRDAHPFLSSANFY